jgi:putative phosphoesterase
MVQYRKNSTGSFHYCISVSLQGTGKREVRRRMNGRLGIISDTHGHEEAWKKALSRWGSVDGVLHCGDVLADIATELEEMIRGAPFPVIISRGNCDRPEDEALLGWPVMAPYATVWWHSRLILVGHGAPFQPLRELGLRCRADLVIYGHTHVGSIVREEGTIFLNPGSAALPKGRDPASAAVLDGDGIRIFVLENGETLHQEPWI